MTTSPRRPSTVYALGTIAAILCAGTGFDASLDLEPPPPPRPRGPVRRHAPAPREPPPPREPTRAELLAAEKRKRKAAKRVAEKGMR